jgi:multiple sugar transport system substrate-binding protein
VQLLRNIVQRQSAVLLAGIVIVTTAVVWYLLTPGLISFPVASPVTKVYFADRISVAHQRIIERFNELHKGKIEVVPVDLPFEKFSTNERKELLARSLRSKSDKLDVFAVDLIWVQRFARWCEPLDRAFGPAERASILPEALRSCLSEQSLVAVPLYLDIGLMYYRKDLIRRLPDSRAVEQKLRESMSWPDVMRLRDRLGYRGRPFYLYQADDYEGLVCNYLELVMAKDPAFLSAGQIDLTKPAALSALELLRDLIYVEKASPPEVVSYNEDQSYTYFLQHDAIFVRGWPNFVENFRPTYPDTAKLAEVGKAALPYFPGQPPTSIFGGWNLMLSKYSNRKPEALEFIRFIQTKEAQTILYEVGGFLPVSQEVYNDSAYMAQHPDLAYTYSLVRRGFHRPALVDYTRISDIIAHYVHLALKNDLSAREALRQASEMIRSNEVLIK